MADSLTEAAPAKVNLYLHVTGRRSDGYHLLDSLVVFAGACDVLEVAPSDTLSLRLEGPFAAGLTDEPDNLVLRAAGEAGVQGLDRLIRQHQINMPAGMRYLPGICAPSSDLHQRFGWLRALRAPQRPGCPEMAPRETVSPHRRS